MIEAKDLEEEKQLQSFYRLCWYPLNPAGIIGGGGGWPPLPCGCCPGGPKPGGGAAGKPMGCGGRGGRPPGPVGTVADPNPGGIAGGCE